MIKIYHNPRCSKSRQTLQILRDKGIEPDIILYLDNPPNVSEIEDLLSWLGMESPQSLLRKGEAVYKELGLKNETRAKILLEAMSQNPKLIERPIVIKGNTAILGRPPENVLNLI